MKKLILALLFISVLYPQVSSQGSSDNIANTVVRRDASGDFDAGNIKGTTLESNSGTTINEFSIDGTLAGNSDDAVPTEKAVKSAIATAVHSPVTLNANATAAGLSLVAQEINYRAATNLQTGYITAALVTNIETNTLKDTNVPTALETGTVDATTYGITSDGGANDVVLVEATTTLAGLLGAVKWDEIVANSLKDTNVPTALILDTPTTTTVPINSDGSSPDITLIEATTSTAGLLGAAKWQEIVASTNHISADGSSHSYINQDVTTSGTPTFDELEVLGNIISKGTDWTIRTSAADRSWRSIAYGNGLFVAVSIDGTGDRVMTSPDGINWTIQTSAANNDWWGVTYGNGLFVAVSNSGTDDRVMTSPDGINWTSRVSAENNSWHSVTYGNGMFVAVASSNTGADDRVMTSPDGINWTIRVSAENNDWRSVTYGNGIFVAVASSNTGTNDRVMTSLNGITWTIQTSAANNSWRSVTYGNGLFVAVSNSNPGNMVMTSPDGINWTLQTTPVSNDWYGVTYGNGLFVAVATTNYASGSVMTSPDGITWTSRVTPAESWHGVTYGNGIFVAVAYSGTDNRVMTSGAQEIQELRHDNIYHGGMNIYGDVVGHGTLGLSAGTTVNEFSTDTGLTGDSDDAVPTEKAVKAYVDAVPVVVAPEDGTADGQILFWDSGAWKHTEISEFMYSDSDKRFGVGIAIPSATFHLKGGATTDLYVDDGTTVVEVRASSSKGSIGTRGDYDFSLMRANVQLLILESQTQVTIGTRLAGEDYSLKFDGESNDGVITYMEDEDRFDFSSDVFIASDLAVANPNSLAGESLNEPDFSTYTNWDRTNDFSDSFPDEKAVYVWNATQTSTLTQTSGGNLAIDGVANKWYKFEYTVAVTTPFDGNGVATITNAFALAAVGLDLSAGTHTIYFISAVVPGDFVISVVSGDDTMGEFTIDDVTLKEITGGDITAVGDVSIGGDFRTQGYIRRATILFQDDFDFWTLIGYENAWDIEALTDAGGLNDISSNVSHITLTTDGEGAGEFVGTRSNYPMVNRTRKNRTEFQFELNQTTDTHYYMGWNDDDVNNMVSNEDKYVIVFYEEGVANWQIKIGNGTDEVVINTGVLVTTDVTIVEIWTETDGTVHLVIDGTTIDVSGSANKMEADAHYLIVGQVMTTEGTAVIAQVGYVVNEKFKAH